MNPRTEYTETFRIAERRRTTKAALVRLLADLPQSGWCTSTHYVRPESVSLPPVPHPAHVAAILGQAGASETGYALFLGDDHAVAVRPPFPLADDLDAVGPHVEPMYQMLDAGVTVGVVLLRLGRYAVAVLNGERLVATKTGSRHVKNRHRKGGSSQRRFERSRERLIRELFDKACEVSGAVFGPHLASIDYVLLGGERHTLGGFVKRCRLMQDLAPKTLSRRLVVDRPGQVALDGIATEVWMSEVIAFEPASGA